MSEFGLPFTQAHLNYIVERAVAARDDEWRAKIKALHSLWRVYDECDHEHTDEDVAAGVAQDIQEVGYTCNQTAVICSLCCTSGPPGWRDQSEECATYHEHTLDPATRCATVRLLAEERARDE
jgi:hypothetical protein